MCGRVAAGNSRARAQGEPEGGGADIAQHFAAPGRADRGGHQEVGEGEQGVYSWTVRGPSLI